MYSIINEGTICTLNDGTNADFYEVNGQPFIAIKATSVGITVDSQTNGSYTKAKSKCSNNCMILPTISQGLNISSGYSQTFVALDNYPCSRTDSTYNGYMYYLCICDGSQKCNK